MGAVFGGEDGDDGGVAITMNGSNTVYVTGYANSLCVPTDNRLESSGHEEFGC